MARNCSSGLTKTARGYCRTIGYYNLNGKRIPRKFRLGYDRSEAKKMFDALTEAWNDLPGDRGKKVWTDAAIDSALSLTSTPPIETSAAADIFPPPPKPVAVFQRRPVPPPLPCITYTLPTALDAFNNYFGERTDISEVHRNGTKSRITSIKRHLEEILVEDGDGSKIWLKDLSISAVDMEWLARIRNKITSRPMTNHLYDDPKPISIDCVKNWLMTLGMAFDWFDRTPRLGWTPPHHRWRENFMLKAKQEYALQTPDERDNDGKPKPAFTVDELVKIYKRCSPLGKKYLLMGLLLGWSQEAIRSFRKSHLVMVGDQYYIDRRRGKTGIEGYWWVCPELAQILIKSMTLTPPNENDLAFLTEEGFPLVHDRTDSIRLVWLRCLPAQPSNVRDLPFGRVKKCGAQIIENLSSHETAQLFLAHRTHTVAARNYVGADVNVGLGRTPYQKLHEAQREMWKQLKPLFMPVKPLAVLDSARSKTLEEATEAA